MKTQMYIVTHKQVDLPEIKGYIPIIVGKNKVQYSDCVRDNSGDNIAEKNPNYCELTALYWLWKNAKGIDNIGLCHYRRFFTNFIFSKNPISIKKIEKLLRSYDIIVPQTFSWFDCTVKEWFLMTDGYKKDVENLRKIISEIYPEYINAYDLIMDGYEAFYFNMSIMPYKLMNAYCEWLFSILFELEKKTDLSEYTATEARIYGFLSERLLNVWVKKQNLKVKYLPVYEKDNGLCLKMKIKNKMKHLVFKYSRLSFLKNGKWGCMKK